MQQAKTLSLLALVTALGGVVGTQLGRDAVAEIDPLFFSAKPEPNVIYTDYAAQPDRLGTPYQASADTGWGYPYWAREPVCWGCPERPDPYLDVYVQPYADPRDAPIPTSGKAAVRMVGEEPTTDETREPGVIDRYAAFPVTQDEARRLAHIIELQRGRHVAEDVGSQEAQAVGM
jgi:hypothetical protein